MSTQKTPDYLVSQHWLQPTRLVKITCHWPWENACVHNLFSIQRLFEVMFSSFVNLFVCLLIVYRWRHSRHHCLFIDCLSLKTFKTSISWTRLSWISSQDTIFTVRFPFWVACEMMAKVYKRKVLYLWIRIRLSNSVVVATTKSRSIQRGKINSLIKYLLLLVSN